MVASCIALCLLTGGVVGGGHPVVPAGAGEPEVPGFSDGDWYLTYWAELEGSGALPSGSAFDGSGSYSGSGSFRVAGGNVVDGTFSGSGIISVFVDAGTGTTTGELPVTAEGIVGGASRSVFLDGNFAIRGSFLILSDLISLTVPVSLTWTDQYPFDIATASCEWVTGEWTTKIRNEGAAATGISASGPAWFSAFRLSGATAALESFRREVEALLADVDRFIAAPVPADAEGFTTWHIALLNLLARAEELLGTVPVVRECGGREEGAEFTTLLEGAVRRLLRATLESFSSFSGSPAVRAQLLADLASAGYRTGAIGAGGSWEGSFALESDLRTAMDAVLTEAIAAGDAAAVSAIEAYARSFGWADIERRARSSA